MKDEALHVWRAAVVEIVADKSAPDLSMRQLAILLTVCTQAPPHTVRGMAQLLAIPGKGAISRCVAALVRHGFVRKQTDPDDGRSVLITPTAKGRRHAESLAGRIVGRAA